MASTTRQPSIKELGPCKTINCGRGASQSAFNLRVSKGFNLYRSHEVEAIGEIFNLFNAKNPARFTARIRADDGRARIRTSSSRRCTRAISSSPSSGSVRLGSASRSRVRSQESERRRTGGASRRPLFLVTESRSGAQLPASFSCPGAPPPGHSPLRFARGWLQATASFTSGSPASYLPRKSSCAAFLSRFIVVGASVDLPKRGARASHVAALLIRNPQIQARFVEVGRLFKRLLEPHDRVSRLVLLDEHDSESVGRVGEYFGSASSARR